MGVAGIMVFPLVLELRGNKDSMKDREKDTGLKDNNYGN
jgi:hypothetical protein